MTETKTLDLTQVSWKAADNGSLEGYLAVFNNEDLGGDVILPGAFKKTLSDWKNAKASIPLMVDHDHSTDGLIGSIKEASEDTHGLRVKAVFAATPRAQDARQKMVDGFMSGMSIGYQIVSAQPGTKDGRAVLFLKELKLIEGSVTPIPMNQLALASAKSAGATGEPMSLDDWLAAIAHAGALPAAARKQALDVLHPLYPAPPAAAAPDGDGTADEAGTDEKSAATSDPSRYALDFMNGISEPPDGALADKSPLLLESVRAKALEDQLEARLTALGGQTSE